MNRLARTLLVLFSLCFAAPLSAQIIPASAPDRVKQLYAADSVWVKFFTWQLNADPTWGKPLPSCWYAYVGSGEQQYKDLMLYPGRWIQDGNTSTHDDHHWPLLYAMLSPYLDDAGKAVWKKRLLALADVAIQVRLTDSDETVFAAVILASVDRLFGTSYTARPEYAAIIAAINTFIDRADGGLWIESSMYDLDTLPWFCVLYGMVGDTALPKAKPLIKAAAKYLVWATTPDFGGCAFWGDTQGDPNDPMWYYRFSTACLLSAFLPQDDRDNINLKDFIREIVPKSAGFTDMYHLNQSLWLLMLYFDPTSLPEQTTHYRPIGLLAPKGRAPVIYRDAKNFITFDARNKTFVDHDESGGFGNVRWLHLGDDGKWTWLLNCPGGYSAGPEAFNSPILAGDNQTYSVWTVSRGLVSATSTATGFQAVGQITGPWQQAGSFTTWSYLDKFQRTVAFDGSLLTIADKWTAGTGPRYDASKPYYQGRFYSSTAMSASGQDGQVTDGAATVFQSDKQQGLVTVSLGGAVVTPPPVVVPPVVVPPVVTPPVVVPPSVGPWTIDGFTFELLPTGQLRQSRLIPTGGGK